jgi:SAM-dependent methyltransferase
MEIGSAPWVAERLRSGAQVSDAAFDALLPVSLQRSSQTWWSPVQVALTAAGWLSELGAQRVVDVGAGLGKFCAIAALRSQRTVVGVEHRAPLVAAGHALAKSLHASVELVHGTLEAVEPQRFDAFYFYNPFAENLCEGDARFDTQVPLSFERYLADVNRVEGWLREAPVGTAMITYNGLGGRIPLSWSVKREQPLGVDRLRLWVKGARDAAADAEEALIEVDAELVTTSRLKQLMREVPLGPGEPPDRKLAALLEAPRFR